MRIILCVLLFSAVAVYAQAPAKSTNNLTDTLINHSLSIVDYPPFDGALEAPKPRFGVYMNNFPADSVRLLTHGKDTISGNRIWQVMPHWAADEAGLLRSDVILRVNGQTLKIQ